MNQTILPSRLVKRLKVSQKGFIVKTQNKLIKTLETNYKSQYGNGFVIPDQVDNRNSQDFTFVMTGLVKTSLSPFNDKKWISRTETYSFGHYRIEDEELVDCLVANSD